MENHMDTWSIGPTSNVRTMDKQQGDNLYFNGNQEKSYLSHGIEQIVDNLTSSSNSQNSQTLHNPQSQTSTSIYQPYNLKDSNSDSLFSFTAESLKVSSLTLPNIPYLGTPERQTYQRDIQIQPGSIEALLNYPSTFSALPIPTTKDNVPVKNLKYPLIDTGLQHSNSFTGYNAKETGLAMLSSLAHTRTPLTEPAEQKKTHKPFNTSTDFQGLLQLPSKDTRRTSTLNVTEHDNIQTSILPQLPNKVPIINKERPSTNSIGIVEPATRLLDVNNFNIISFVEKNDNNSLYNDREDNGAGEVISITVENVPYSNTENNLLYYPETDDDKAIHITNVIDHTNICEEDKHSEKYVYSCGACDLIYGTICNLLVHLESHGSWKSFLFHRETRTVYPQFGCVNVEVQTDELMIESNRVDCEDAANGYVEMDPIDDCQPKINETNTLEIQVPIIPVCDETEPSRTEYKFRLESFLPTDNYVEDEKNMDTENSNECKETDKKDPDFVLDDDVENNSESGEDDNNAIHQVKKTPRKPVTRNRANNERTQISKIGGASSATKKSKLGSEPTKTSKIGSESTQTSKLDSERTKILKLGSESTKTSKLGSGRTKIPKLGFESTKPSKLGSESTKVSKLGSAGAITSKLGSESTKTLKLDSESKGNVSKKKIKYVQDKESQNNATTKKELTQCSLCEEKLEFSIRLKPHLASVHDITKTYKCRMCPVQVKSLEELKEHRELHKNQEFRCNICDKVVSSAASLRDHTNFHLGVKPHECKTCGQFFRTTGQLNVHIREKHDKSFSQMCESCGKTYYSRNQMREHRKQCLEIKPHKCNTCGKRFIRTTQLRVHERIHSGERPYVCDICGYALTNYSSLIKHRRIHTGEKPYKCEKCSMAFTAKTTLDDHIKTHTQDKPFQCGYCERTFIKKCNLKTHIRQHTGETPYKCKICGQGYKQNVLLKTHMQIHNKPIVVEPGIEAEKIGWTAEQVLGGVDGLQVETEEFRAELITHSL